MKYLIIICLMILSEVIWANTIPLADTSYICYEDYYSRKPILEMNIKPNLNTFKETKDESNTQEGSLESNVSFKLLVDYLSVPLDLSAGVNNYKTDSEGNLPNNITVKTNIFSTIYRGNILEFHFGFAIPSTSISVHFKEGYHVGNDLGPLLFNRHASVTEYFRPEHPLNYEASGKLYLNCRLKNKGTYFTATLRSLQKYAYSMLWWLRDFKSLSQNKQLYNLLTSIADKSLQLTNLPHCSDIENGFKEIERLYNEANIQIATLNQTAQYKIDLNTFLDTFRSTKTYVRVCRY